MLGLDLAQVIVPLLAFKFLFTINFFSELLSSAVLKGVCICLFKLFPFPYTYIYDNIPYDSKNCSANIAIWTLMLKLTNHPVLSTGYNLLLKICGVRPIR